MKTLPLMMCALACLLLSNDLMGQERVYDLSNYKARYERRPGMLLRASSSYDGLYDKNSTALNRFVISSETTWFLQKNTDDLISTWNWTSNLGGSNTNGTFTYNLGLNFDLSRFHYRDAKHFWGWSLLVGFAEAGADRPGIDRNARMDLNPSIFMGVGRVEFAEDALLANWMLEDLQDIGLTPSYTAADVEALAMVITDLIGNRVFDFRRRRIYELKRLQQVILERGLAKGESFDLFAILNDNWAFANRATLTHGKRFRYGLRSSNDAYARRNAGEVEYSSILHDSEGFVEYIYSSIIGNNGSQSFSAGLDVGYYAIQRERINDFLPRSEDQGWRADVSLAYNRVWLPNSRTTFDWSNQLTASRYLSYNTGLEFGENPFFVTAEFQSRWSVRYFIDYHWTIRATAGAAAQYYENTGRYRLDPLVTFNMFYFLF